MALTYSSDPGHSRIGFVGRHMVFTKVRGQFNEFSATVTVPDGGDQSRAQVKGSIKTASVSTANEQRDGHLRSGDFFDAEKYPEMTFESTSVKPLGQGRYEVTGNLAIRGTSKPITVEAAVEGPLQDPWGNERYGVEAHAKVNRKDWGLNWNMALEAGGVLVSDEIEIEIEAAFVRSLQKAGAETEAEATRSA